MVPIGCSVKIIEVSRCCKIIDLSGFTKYFQDKFLQNARMGIFNNLCRLQAIQNQKPQGQAAGDFFLGRAAGLPAYGDFCPDRVGLPTGAVSRLCSGGQTNPQPVPGGKRQEQSGRHPQKTARRTEVRQKGRLARRRRIRQIHADFLGFPVRPEPSDLSCTDTLYETVLASLGNYHGRVMQI